MRNGELDRDRSVLVCPDAFKGTFSAAEVAEAIGEGLRDRGLTADLCPLADGGEGTAAALAAARGGHFVRASAHDPLGRPVEAGFALLDDGETAVVEVAAASGLTLVEPEDRDAEAADSYGTGELIAAAAAAGARHVVVAAGGSATTDGGAGALAALAAAGGGAGSPAGPAAPGGLRGARLTVLCDVRTPWESAAARFAPQKGADPAAVRRLAERLDALAEALPRDPRGIPMTGCAGGLSGGLWAACDAELVPGAGWVMDAVGFDARLARSRAVITGEGRLDDQSFEGKLPGEVAARAAAVGIPAIALVGSVDVTDRAALDRHFAAVVEAGTLQKLRDTATSADVPGLHGSGLRQGRSFEPRGLRRST